MLLRAQNGYYPAMRSEPLLQAVIDTMIDGVILIDHGGIVRLYNPACQKLFGYRPEEVLGRNVKMLMTSMTAISSITSILARNASSAPVVKCWASARMARFFHSNWRWPKPTMPASRCISA